MIRLNSPLVVAALLFAAPMLVAQPTESSITNQLRNLRSVPTDKRPAATKQLALDIRELPASARKVQLADELENLSTEGDAGPDTLQAVADTLSKALAESPVPTKGDRPPAPYLDLAKLVRYEGAKATLDDPLYAKAMQTLVADDAEIGKADFTLRDVNNKKVTLSELRGKIVIVNFWATWCPPCRLEMPDLDFLYSYFKSQGLVVLSITNEEPMKVDPFIAEANYHPTVLLDHDDKVHKMFHVEGIPKTFVFNREGKLVAEAIDQRTRRQFLQMLSNTDLHP